MAFPLLFYRVRSVVQIDASTAPEWKSTTTRGPQCGIMPGLNLQETSLVGGGGGGRVSR